MAWLSVHPSVIFVAIVENGESKPIVESYGMAQAKKNGVGLVRDYFSHNKRPSL